MVVNTKKPCLNQVESLKYQPREVAHKANTIFIEKEWHASRYPKVVVDMSSCINCGKCRTVCPIIHLVNDSSGNVMQNEASACIHCFNCVITCPAKAISLSGDLEKARAYMTNMIKNSNERPQSAVYPSNTVTMS